MDETKTKLLESVKKVVDDFNTGYLEADLGYKFRTRDFMNIVFLYSNSVDVANPDILGADNRNTFIFEPMAQLEKIKEQIRLDIKDLNFTIDNASSMARFIPRAANRKMLKENNFEVEMDEIPDNAVDYGSGFLKIWMKDKKLKLKSIDPYSIYFDQYNFKDGKKVESFRRTIRSIIDDEKYDIDMRTLLRIKTEEEKMDDFITLHQSVQDFPDETQQITVCDFVNDLVYYDYTTKDKKQVVSYYKFDVKKRKGFADALGVGYIERVFNKIVQSKVNRERLDKVLEIASKLPFQKKIDNERDNYVGKTITDMDTGVILGHKGNPIEPMNTGGDKQIAILQNQIITIMNTIGTDLNMTEALQGNTMPSGTSGVLGNLLAENASSVYKEIKKKLANFFSNAYDKRINEYILGAFNSKEDMKKYLDPGDVRIVENGVVDYLVAMKRVDKAIAGEEFDLVQATMEARNEIKGQKLIPDEALLKQLRKEVEGIRSYISGEDVSKAQTVAFLREMRSTFATNPALFQSPFFVELLKKEAEFDSGVSGIEIDNLLKELKNQEQPEIAPGVATPQRINLPQ
jgi:hypothetical protein